MNSYHIGQVVRIRAAFANSNGSAVDPETVTFKVKSPLAQVTTFVLGVDEEVEQDSTGNYHVDLEPTIQGVWAVRWIGTGDNKAAGESSFEMIESQFD